ncbi:uncharacterized protein LOC129614266 [Condylostylus longicornis]|uniref:uncharacterized protein LOC129614266 n=1 Tax=Condylostylus longicornis TaxID=2530218 RepID=UPI00244E04A7|nr:uncharacterized protein LOC129614266 [Condylostylus longicornis]
MKMNSNEYSGPGPPSSSNLVQILTQSPLSSLLNSSTSVISPSSSLSSSSSTTTATTITTSIISSTNVNTISPSTSIISGVKTTTNHMISPKINVVSTITTTTTTTTTLPINIKTSSASSSASLLSSSKSLLTTNATVCLSTSSQLPPSILQQPQLQLQQQQQQTVVRTISSDRLVTGPSCRALKTAVSALYSVDDFIKEKIGSGFFSEVYKVTHRTTGQVMVLKMNQLRSNRPNMLREVQLLNKLSHPNILRFMGVCVQEGQLHALTEYIEGGSLEQLLANKSETLTPVLKIRLSIGIARGMQYVHEAGLFHRDLTSKNVLIRKLPDGLMDAVVGDFGLAAKIPNKSGKARLDTVGSPYWMSPECLRGLWYDQTSDVFSYGIVLCEIIACIEADPDIMPRTHSFGLDYLAFVELCPEDTPPAFLRLAFYCCIYDSKNRPTFSEIVKKLTALTDKLCENTENYLKYNESSPNESDSEPYLSTNTIIPPKRYSMDVSSTTGLFKLSMKNVDKDDSDNDYDIGREKLRVKNVTKTLEAELQHRRSLSENVINFPLHTTPSDKARCHQILRPKSSNTSSNSNSQELPILKNITLRKVAETMCLKDPQYKPIKLDQNGVKLNPFTALAQLKGVKKILGDPRSYTACAGDLFSSCFEMSAPFFKEHANVGTKPAKQIVEPKSLPTSPNMARKLHQASESKFNANTNSIKVNPVINFESDFQITNNTLIDSKCDNIESKSTKKTKLKSLYIHPLFKNDVTENKPSFLIENHTDNSNGVKFKQFNCSDSSTDSVDLKNEKLNRRDSMESGVFSCFNEESDTLTNYKSSRACLCNSFGTNKIPSNFGSSIEKFQKCCKWCCKVSNLGKDDTAIHRNLEDLKNENDIQNENINLLQSFDDLDIGETKDGQHHCIHHNNSNNINHHHSHHHHTLDSTSVDMGLINRLALDSEINSLIQKSQLAHQLLYCKNRTSSLYTDSSDDISSLAGSDSLLWDSRSFVPNAKSAQIAKIVEYFERKSMRSAGRFVNDTLPFKTHNTSTSVTSGSGISGGSSSSSISAHALAALGNCSEFSNFNIETNCSNRRGFSSGNDYHNSSKITPQSDYEQFCFELEQQQQKPPTKTMQRLNICEGAVKSKLPIFDKPKQNCKKE